MTPTTAPRADVEAQRRRTERLLRTLPEMLTIPEAQPTEPAALRREIRTATRVLQRIPRHAPVLQWRRTLCVAAGRLLAEAAAHTSLLVRAEEFAAAIEWLNETRQLACDGMALPGGCAIPFSGPMHAITHLHRDPIGHLQLLERQVVAARDELEQETQTILTAESQLDLAAAEQAIDAMATHYGGVSPTVTRQRDQLHRLGFYLERVARSQTNVERVATTWDAIALAPLTEFVAAAVEAVHGRSRHESSTGVVGLRSLQITLVNLGEEFPHVAAVTASHEALSQALVDLTDRAWQALGEANTLLRSVPVPVRPLQAAIGRLDTLRILDAFVDRPDRPRSQLQDAIESLRLRLDQARATRDRLAEGAENAMARGHWTTGLFDMERAVAELNPLDEQDRAEATRLQARLAAAKRRRQEVDAAVRRNVELTTRYGTLQDDPSASFAERLQVLAERRDCLHLLTMNVPSERARLYAKDLRDVETHIALERAALAEQRLDSTTNPAERVQITRTTSDQVAAAVALAGHEAEAPGRLLRLWEHWRNLASQCQAAADRLQHELDAAAQRRRRRWSMAAVAVSVVSVSMLALGSWWSGNQAAAGTRTGASDALHTNLAALPEPMQTAAGALRELALAPAAATTFEFATWHEQWRDQLRSYVTAAAGSSEEAAARTFAVHCWDAALHSILLRLDADEARSCEAATAALVEELRPYGVQPSVR